MLSVKSNLHIVRASSVYDLIMTAGFMTPWSASLVLKGFAALSAASALERPVPTFDVNSMLFANLLEASSSSGHSGDLCTRVAVWVFMMPTPEHYSRFGKFSQ